MTERLASWSARVYAWLLWVYPAAFRREFGESMAQAFRDLARDARRESGLAGLVRLWGRTAVDLAVGAAGAYGRERRTAMFRPAAALGLVFLSALILAPAYGALRYGEFYAPPSFNRFAAGEAVHEDTLIAGYERALAGDFGDYKTFAAAAGLTVSVLLGLTAALIGLWQRSLVHGAGALVAGAAAATAALELLPAIWFPFDTYSAGWIWVQRGFPIAAAVWLVAALAGSKRRPGAPLQVHRP